MTNQSLARMALIISLLVFAFLSLQGCSSRPRGEQTSASSSQPPSEGSMIPGPAPLPEKLPPAGAEPPPVIRRMPWPPIHAPVAPAPAPSDDELLQQSLARMQHGNLVYNTPDRMKTGQTGHVIARIGTHLVSLHDLQSGMPATPGTQTASAPTPVSTRMKMKLTSSDFDITPLSSEEQWVAGDTPTTWDWDIIPRHSGSLNLHLVAVVELNGLSKDYKTIDKDIAVAVDPVDAATKFAKENTVWILGILGTAIAALFAWWKKSSKANP